MSLVPKKNNGADVRLQRQGIPGISVVGSGAVGEVLSPSGQMTCSQFKAARKALNYSTEVLAAALGLGMHGKRTIERIEAGGTITGPMSLAVQKLLDDHNKNRGE